jgi:hypothetical protein
LRHLSLTYLHRAFFARLARSIPTPSGSFSSTGAPQFVSNYPFPSTCTVLACLLACLFVGLGLKSIKPPTIPNPPFPFFYPSTLIRFARPLHSHPVGCVGLDRHPSPDCRQQLLCEPESGGCHRGRLPDVHLLRHPGRSIARFRIYLDMHRPGAGPVPLQ